MKNLIKRTHFALYILLLLVLFISCTHVSTEQKVTVEKYCEDTYYVETCVWVNNWYGLPISLEMIEIQVVDYNQIDSVRGVQSVMADSCRIKIERCLKH